MKYAITKYIEANDIQEAIKKEKEAPLDVIECIEYEEKSNKIFGFQDDSRK